MSRFKNLQYQKFGKLTILSVYQYGSNGKHTIWEALCDCGKSTRVKSSDIIRGHTKSCGCFKIERLIIHGKKSTATYRIWSHILGRCHNKTDKAYKNYGGRGIFVCFGWRSNFENFYKDMGDKPVNRSIDRIDNNGPYSCGKCSECISRNLKFNCRWVDRCTQSRNKRNSINVTFNGKTQCLKDWSNEFGIGYNVLRYRLKKGWNFENLFKPIK